MSERERVILIGCQTQKESDDTFLTSLNELRALADTVNAEIVDVFTQKREKIHNALYIGTGKVEEIKQYIEENEIELAIMNGELSPSQIRNLNKHWDISVIDRTQLILDIFAMRANTKEGNSKSNWLNWSICFRDYMDKVVRSLAWEAVLGQEDLVKQNLKRTADIYKVASMILRNS